MDDTNPKIIEKITEEKINKNVKMGSINEKEMIIERYEKVLNFLKGVPIINDENLDLIKKPLDDLESNLKYVPNGPLFKDVIPTEMKDTILNYLCDSNSFIAACVCQEWKKILDNKFEEKRVIISEDCSKCEQNKCVKMEDMMRAATDHNIDMHLVIYQSVEEIDTQVVTDALINVGKFTITFDNDYGDVLSTEKFEHLLESIENGNKIMEEVNLLPLDLPDVNKERLVNCFVNKIKKLKLEFTCVDDAEILLETFMTKLQQDSGNLKLTHLTLCYGFSMYPNNIADGLCKVKNVKLCNYLLRDSEVSVVRVINRLLENILQMPVVMKTLIIDIDSLREECCPDFGPLISPQDLKSVFNKMATLHLEGVFTLKQLEAVRSLPDVEVSRKQFESEELFFHSLKKGPSGIF